MKQTFTLLGIFLFALSSYAQSTETKEESIATTTINFAEETFEWGEITQGEKIQNVFYFTNTGEEPLIIINAKGSCGCTVPRFPKEPIAPGQTASLLVQFDSKNKKGLQSKRVTITTNTDPAITYLTIKGKVTVPEKTDELLQRFDDFDIMAESINIYPNPASSIVNLTIEDNPGEEANIEIYNSLGQRMESIYIEKVNEAPTEINVQQYTPGLYTMSINLKNNNRIAKQFKVVR
ncbi:DUF1573 domain-containing protein [Maribacter sp.]|uniref:DUF1573 domain-containing protein n=1 Tax=Maribacter sp. TaxID=1897614 RepID=UPI0025C0F026|nr:DUF1573 domain-containing protein [Maribacter sp.]